MKRRHRSRRSDTPIETVRIALERLEDRDVPTVVGGLDPSFGTEGKVTTNFGAADLANAVALQPDGKIVVVGKTGLAGIFDFAVARLNPDGSPDNTFGGGGRTTPGRLRHRSRGSWPVRQSRPRPPGSSPTT